MSAFLLSLNSTVRDAIEAVRRSRERNHARGFNYASPHQCRELWNRLEMRRWCRRMIKP